MRNTTRRIAALAALTWLTFGGGARAGDITYTIVAYPSITNGYTVTGTITTNGATGTQLPASDITGWDITVSQGTTQIAELTSTNSIDYSTTFDASATEISAGSAGDTLSFYGGHPQSYVAYSIAWEKVYANSPPGYYGVQVLGASQIRYNWSGSLPTSQSPVATAAAAVPEPSTGVLAGISAVSALAYVHHRKRQARRRRGDGGRSEPAE